MHKFRVDNVRTTRFQDWPSSHFVLLFSGRQRKNEERVGLKKCVCEYCIRYIRYYVKEPGNFCMGNLFRFQQLLEVQMENDDEDKYVNVADDDPHANLIMEVIKNDSLRRLERVKKHESENCILTAAKLISPMIEDSFSAGYNWCVDTIKMSSQHSQLANDLEINKAVMFLRQKEFGAAVDTLKAFERQEGTKIASTASTNLSFLYLLQGKCYFYKL